MNPPALLADVGPGPLAYPMVGGLYAAGAFAAAAAVAGGFWLAGRPAAPRARRWFLASAGLACAGGTVFLAVLGLFLPLLWVAAVGLAVGGSYLLWLSFRPARPPSDEPRDPADGAG